MAKVLHATWQRCRVHTMRNLLAHAGRQGRGVAAAFIATAFAQNDAAAAKTQWRKVADQLRPKLPKLAAAMDEAEVDVLAYMDFPAAHWTKLHSTNSLERLNGEVKRRTDVVGIFPNEEAIYRLVGAILLEQNDEWSVQRARYMTLETIATLSDDATVSLPPGQTDTSGQTAGERNDAARSYTTAGDTIPAGATHPVAKRGTIQRHALAREDLRLAIQRQVVSEFVHQHMRQQRLGGHAAIDRPLARGRLHDGLFAGPAAISRPADQPDPKLRWNIVQHLCPVLADLVQRAAATG